MLSLNNLNTYKEKTSKKIDEILLSTKTADISNLFSSKHHYLFKIRPFNTTEYYPFAYLKEVRMHTENDEQHMTLNKWISKSRTLALATMKSTNTERDDIFDLKMSTNSVYTDTDIYQIYRSWLDSGNHMVSMPNQNYFSEYEFDCIDLSKFSFCTSWNYLQRYSRSCEIVVYIDGKEKYSNIFNGLSDGKSHFSIVLNESGTEIKEVSVN